MNPTGAPNSSPDAISLRTLSKRTGIDPARLMKIMRKAGITKATDGKPLYGTRGLVPVADALAAVEKWKTDAPVPATATTSANPLSALRTDAAAAKSGLLEPAPVPSGNLEDDPVDPAEVRLVGDLSSGDFPSVPNVPSGKKHFWWNVDPRRMEKKRLQGWRAVTDPKLIKQMDPSGRLSVLRGVDGRVHWGDTVLCLIDLDLWLEQKSRQRSVTHDIEAAVEDHRANVESMQKHIRDRHGEPGEKHVSVIEGSGEEIEAREEHSRTKRRADQSGVGA